MAAVRVTGLSQTVSVSPWVNVEKCFFVTLVISGHFLELRTAMPKAANWQMDPQWYVDGQCLDCSSSAALGCDILGLFHTRPLLDHGCRISMATEWSFPKKLGFNISLYGLTPFWFVH